jgi:hypothetical protein
MNGSLQNTIVFDVAHPSFNIGPSPKPQKPKQTFKPLDDVPEPFFPPK